MFKKNVYYFTEKPCPCQNPQIRRIPSQHDGFKTCFCKKNRKLSKQERKMYKNFKPPDPPSKDPDAWELQFCKWWGWNWVRKKDENRSCPCFDKKGFCAPLRNMCKKLCCRNEYEDMQRIFDTPCNSINMHDDRRDSESLDELEAQRNLSSNCTCTEYSRSRRKRRRRRSEGREFPGSEYGYKERSLSSCSSREQGKPECGCCKCRNSLDRLEKLKHSRGNNTRKQAPVKHCLHFVCCPCNESGCSVKPCCPCSHESESLKEYTTAHFQPKRCRPECAFASSIKKNPNATEAFMMHFQNDHLKNGPFQSYDFLGDKHFTNIFDKDLYKSPLTGRVYNLNMFHLNNIEVTRSDLPEPLDPSKELHASKAGKGGLGKTDLKDRVLLDAICDAILRSPRRFEAEDVLGDYLRGGGLKGGFVDSSVGEGKDGNEEGFGEWDDGRCWRGLKRCRSELSFGVRKRKRSLGEEEFGLGGFEWTGGGGSRRKRDSSQ